MNIQPQPMSSSAESEVNLLYQSLIDAWNQRNAAAFAALFMEDGASIGFDGSQMRSRAEINATLQQIFSDHPTRPYITKIKDVRFLSPDIALLNAISGMIPHGQSDPDPSLNTIQTLVATRNNSTWHIALFQNTPAQLHGRPDLVQQMTEELSQK